MFPAPPDPTRQPQIVYRVDPEVRYVLSPNQKGWVDDGFVTTNSRGFRGGEVDIPKPPGRLRIVALGDSVVFGWGVNDADTFCQQLEQQFRARRPDVDVDVVNLAVPGYATRQEVALLQRNLAALQPDVVLLGFYENDLPDTMDDKNVSGTRINVARPADGQELHMSPGPSSWIERQARRSRAVYIASHALKGLVHHGEGKPGSSMELDLLEGRRSDELETAWQRVSAQLEALKSSAADRGFAAGIVVLPPREQVFGLYPDSEYQKRIGRVAGQSGHVRDRSASVSEGAAEQQGNAVHSLRSESSVRGGPSGDRAGDHGIFQPAPGHRVAPDTPGADASECSSRHGQRSQEPGAVVRRLGRRRALVIALVLWWRGRVGRAEILGGIGAVLLVCGAGASAAAQVAERGLVAILAGVLGYVNARILLTLHVLVAAGAALAAVAPDRQGSAGAAAREIRGVDAVSGALSRSHHYKRMF